MSPFQKVPITVRSDVLVLLSISPETFHFVKDPRIPVARQCWRRLRIKFIGARQSKGSDSRPLREICRCEIGRRELVVSGIVARNE